MAKQTGYKARKDPKGRVLNQGEAIRGQDGKYMYTYTDPYGERHRIYGNTLEELRAKEKEVKKDQLEGIDRFAAQSCTINEMFDRYMASKRELRGTTRVNYNYMYDRYVRKGFGKKKIGEVKFSDVMFFYQDLLENKALQPNTLDTIHTVLHPTFELAVRDELIRRNPSTGVMTEIKKKWGKNTGIRHALTREQQKLFLDYVAHEPVFYHWWSLFTFLLGTGCRIGEVVGLRWQDVDMEKREININHSVTYYSRDEGRRGRSEYQVSLPKTEAGIRVIPMLDAVYEALKYEQEEQLKHGGCKVELEGMTGFIFSNRFGNLYNPSVVNRAIKRIVQCYNAEEEMKASKAHRAPVMLPFFSCHSFRHTFATRLCEEESNLKVIQSIMGHANIETTMDVYAEATAEKKRESMDNLSKKLNVF